MTILLALLRRYWLHIVVVAALSLLAWRAYDWAYDNGWNANRQLWLERENHSLKQALKERDEARAKAAAAQKKADELAKLPAKVIERVRQNPAKCDLPEPVADELRKQVDEINAAIREHNRNVSRNSSPASR
jgi:hypothetical protein